jgi:hypothetical protein
MEAVTMRDPFKKLWTNVSSNAVRPDENGEWTKISSSTNKRRMEKTGSSVGGAAGENSKEWKPSRLYVTPEELKIKFEQQDGKCHWFGIDLDLDLLFNDHPDWLPKHPLAPSVDRLDDEDDYTFDNIVITCRFANFGRNVYPADRMPALVELLRGQSG